MPKKRHTPDEIVSKLRQVDVLVAQGTPVADAIAPSASLRSRTTAGARSTAGSSRTKCAG
jgi:hypothetical protein